MSEFKEQFDRLPGGLLITDQKSRAVYANPAVEKRTGFAVGEIIGKKPGQLWGGKMARSFYQKMWRTIAREEQPFVGTVENVHKAGLGYQESIFIAPIKDQSGHAKYFAEIHPAFQNRSEEESFGREFVFRGRRFNKEQNSLAWIFQSLRGQRQAGVEKIPSGGHFQDLASLFYEMLIEPVERIFHRRRDDAQLVRAAQEDGKKFSQLYEKYYLLIEQYFLRRLNNDVETAADLTQETFARAFKHLPYFRLSNASYYTYLLRIAHNLLVNQYRKRSDRALFPQEVELLEAPAFFQETAGFEALLSGLSEKERAVMLMKYQDGLKVRDIAKKTGKSENAVKLILSRTRKKLKEKLTV